MGKSFMFYKGTHDELRQIFVDGIERLRTLRYMNDIENLAVDKPTLALERALDEMEKPVYKKTMVAYKGRRLAKKRASHSIFAEALNWVLLLKIFPKETMERLYERKTTPQARRNMREFINSRLSAVASSLIDGDADGYQEKLEIAQFYHNIEVRLRNLEKHLRGIFRSISDLRMENLS